jgi:hypothetical protein
MLPNSCREIQPFRLVNPPSAPSPLQLEQTKTGNGPTAEAQPSSSGDPCRQPDTVVVPWTHRVLKTAQIHPCRKRLPTSADSAAEGCPYRNYYAIDTVGFAGNSAAYGLTLYRANSRIRVGLDAYRSGLSQPRGPVSTFPQESLACFLRHCGSCIKLAV